MEVYTIHVKRNTSWCFKGKIIHFLASSVRKMYIQVHTGIYCHVRIYTKVTTTYHFESGLIRLAMPTSFQSTVIPRLSLSSRAASFLSAVSSSLRPPRRGVLHESLQYRLHYGVYLNIPIDTIIYNECTRYTRMYH
jgi:hypothetical protein